MYQRLDGGPLERAEFRVTADPMSGARCIEVACPSCAHASQLPDTHRVRRDGAVTPIWVCESESCPYADWLQIEEICQ